MVWCGVGRVGWLLGIDLMPKIILETLALLGTCGKGFARDQTYVLGQLLTLV